MNSNEKVVLITGGSRGIGKETAREFAKAHYHIILNYLQSEVSALKLKEELETKYQIKILPIKADISDEKQVQQMVEKSIQAFGKIDVLVNNAGIAIDTTFEDKTVKDFRKIIDINLIGTFLMSKYVGEEMKKNQNGSIINISSTNGIDTGYPEGLDYDASKAGVISLSKNLAIQFAPYIRVNTIASGWVNTDMNQNLDNNFKNEEYKKILLNRFAEPKEIAKVIVFLASESASYINGTVIRVDGGCR